MRRLDLRIRRSKRSGKLVLAGVLLVSLGLGVVLGQALVLATQTGQGDLAWRAGLGLALLAALDAFSILMVRRQHRILDDAREELQDLVRLPDPDEPTGFS